MADVNQTLTERGQRYGEFKSHAMISQGLKQAMRNTSNWDKLAPDQQECLEMVAHKVGRILNGDPDYADSWHDIAGYATLVEQALSTGQQQLPLQAPPATPLTGAAGSGALKPISPLPPLSTPGGAVPPLPSVKPL